MWKLSSVGIAHGLSVSEPRQRKSAAMPASAWVLSVVHPRILLGKIGINWTAGEPLFFCGGGFNNMSSTAMVMHPHASHTATLGAISDTNR